MRAWLDPRLSSTRLATNIQVLWCSPRARYRSQLSSRVWHAVAVLRAGRLHRRLARVTDSTRPLRSRAGGSPCSGDSRSPNGAVSAATCASRAGRRRRRSRTSTASKRSRPGRFPRRRRLPVSAQRSSWRLETLVQCLHPPQVVAAYLGWREPQKVTKQRVPPPGNMKIRLDRRPLADRTLSLSRTASA